MSTDIPAVVEGTADSRGRVAMGSQFAGQQIRAAVDAALDLSNLTVGFARHQLGVSKEGKKAMYADRRFGIDWEVGPLISEDVYEEHGEGAVKDIRAMNRFRNNAALVYALFEEVSSSHALMGIVPLGAEIEPVAYEARGGDEEDDEVVYVKTLKLRLPVEVSADEAPELFERNRHPRGSVRRWNSMADEVRQVYADLRGFRLE